MARRKADLLIAQQRVIVNGNVGTAGQQVTPGVDRVSIDGRVIEPPASWTYLAMNKPAGVLTSVGDPRGRPTVTDFRGTDRRVFPVGRLDLDSRGLLLLTDDGDLAMRLMHPRYGVEKEYVVLISGQPSVGAFRQLGAGLVIKGERFQPAVVRVLIREPTQTRVAMVLREGRKREVRRLWQALGHTVLDLQRVRIDGVDLGELGEGEVRALTRDEVDRLKRAVS